MTDMEGQTCLADGCQNSAKQVCPECSKLGRQSYFCSQDCFKKSWPTHKKTHPPKPKPKPAPPPGIDVTSTEAHIARAKDTLDKIRQYAADAANATAPDLTDEQKRKCERKLAGGAGVCRVNWTSGNFKDLLTPNTMIKFETPRLIIRAVKPSDEAWIYSVKGDARVNKYQLYGQPTGKADAMTFGNGYIRDRIPLLDGRRGGDVTRTRYVFALTPKASVIPKPESNAIPRVKRLPPHTPLPHEDDVYIGNIAFEIEPIADVVGGRGYNMAFGGSDPQPLRIPANNIFHWPDADSPAVRQELDGWAALLFYEIAPQYWGQGLMNEAMLAISDFVFFELGLGHIAIDPQVANTASISLAKKFPDMEYASTITCRSNFSIRQHVFSASRADYLKRFGPPPVTPAGKKGCSYCYNPRAVVRGEGETCPSCKKRWYCSLECRAADWEIAEGHGVRCRA